MSQDRRVQWVAPELTRVTREIITQVDQLNKTSMMSLLVGVPTEAVLNEFWTKPGLLRGQP